MCLLDAEAYSNPEGTTDADPYCPVLPDFGIWW
jgi:hypothetical protein